MNQERISETLMLNLKVLQRLEARKFDNILYGDFREAFQVEKSMNLKLQSSMGYVLGLKDGDILNEEEKDGWLEAVREATLHKFSSEEMDEILHAPHAIQDYIEWVKIYLS